MNVSATNSRDSLADAFANYARCLADMAPNNLSAHAMHTLDNRACDLRGRISDMLEARGVDSVPDYLEHAPADARAIAARLVADALAAGYLVSVRDGLEWTVKQSRNAHTILAAMASTDADTLKFRDAATGDAIGSVWLIWCNGCDVISDYSAPNAAMLSVLKGAEELAEHYAAR